MSNLIGTRSPIEITGYDATFYEIRDSFIKAAEFAGIKMNSSDIVINFISQSDHRPPALLPKGNLAVYVFMFGRRCLKVGKAGSKSSARFCSQHYGVKARSTLAKSIIQHQRKLSASGIDEHTVKKWICENTYRVNFIVPMNTGPLILSLLEAFVQCCLKPEFEGFSGQQIENNLFFTRDWF